jgi:hypothetical protein
MSRLLISFSIAALLPVAAGAQPTSFQGPIRGFVFSHGSRTLRPVFGVSGASYIGSAVMGDVDSASVAPGGKWAVITQGGHSSCFQGLSSLSPAESTPAGLIDAVDRVLWNADGSYALLFSSSGNQLQRVRFSDSAASPDAPVDLTPWGQATVLAIDPAGQRIVFGVAGSGLYLYPAGQSPALLSPMATPSVAAFDATGKWLYAADLDQQQIVKFDSSSNATTFAALAQTGVAAVNPAGLAVSGDGNYVMLADSAGQAVQVYSIADGSLANTIPLDFSPSRFETLNPGTFLLNGDNSNEWLLLLDARQIPSISFVPANQEVAQ